MRVATVRSVISELPLRAAASTPCRPQLLRQCRRLDSPSDSASTPQPVEDMLLLMAARAGGLKPGRHIVSAGAQPLQSLLGCMQAVGFRQDQLAEVPGAPAALRG